MSRKTELILEGIDIINNRFKRLNLDKVTKPYMKEIITKALNQRLVEINNELEELENGKK